MQEPTSANAEQHEETGLKALTRPHTAQSLHSSWLGRSLLLLSSRMMLPNRQVRSIVCGATKFAGGFVPLGLIDGLQHALGLRLA